MNTNIGKIWSVHLLCLLRACYNLHHACYKFQPKYQNRREEDLNFSKHPKSLKSIKNSRRYNEMNIVKLFQIIWIIACWKWEKSCTFFPRKILGKSMKIIDFSVRFAQFSIISISRTTEPILKILSVLKCYDFSLQVKNASSTFPWLSYFAV